MNADNARPRLGLLAITALSLFGALFARLWFLQIVEGQTLAEQVTSNTRRTVIVQAPRGRILDRTGVVLVDNRDSTVVGIDFDQWSALPRDEQPKVLARVARELNRYKAPNDRTTVKAIGQRLNDERFSHLRPVPIVTDATV